MGFPTWLPGAGPPQGGRKGVEFIFADPSDRFYRPHSASLLPNGNVLLFDNGNRRPDSEGGQFSRALELELDLDEMTATTVWEYRYTQPLFAICCSSVQRLENGNTVLLFGSMFADECCRIYVIAEVDRAGRTLWEVRHVSPGKQNQYRVHAAESIMGERKLAPPVE